MSQWVKAAGHGVSSVHESSHGTGHRAAPDDLPLAEGVSLPAAPLGEPNELYPASLEENDVKQDFLTELSGLSLGRYTGLGRFRSSGQKPTVPESLPGRSYERPKCKA
jgi:hypothetical protein